MQLCYPEIPIRYGFGQTPDAEYQDLVLHSISPSIIDHDNSIFLEYNLRLIGQERFLDVAWPGEATIRCLVQIASGLFIWAAIHLKGLNHMSHTSSRVGMLTQH
jgi:hypothetical protein